jgi:hypothetical protein
MASFNTFITFVILASLTLAFIATPIVREIKAYPKTWLGLGLLAVVLFLIYK